MLKGYFVVLAAGIIFCVARHRQIFKEQAFPDMGIFLATCVVAILGLIFLRFREQEKSIERDIRLEEAARKGGLKARIILFIEGICKIWLGLIVLYFGVNRLISNQAGKYELSWDADKWSFISHKLFALVLICGGVCLGYNTLCKFGYLRPQKNKSKRRGKKRSSSW